MRQVHNVIIVPFIMGSVYCLLVKSGIPQNTFMLIQGDSVECVIHSFFERYGYEILSIIRYGRRVFYSVAEPTGYYWILVKELIQQEALEGRFTFFDLHDQEYVDRGITKACQHAITTVPL